MKTWKKVFCLSVTTVLTSATFANSVDDYLNPVFNCMHPVITLTGGLTYSSDVGRSQNLPIIDDSIYSYANDSGNGLRGVYGAFIGQEFKIHPAWTMQLGLAFYQHEFTATGVLTQGADPESFDRFDYRYDIRSNQFLIESKFLYDCFHCFHPYISAGVGVAYNEANNYQVNYPVFLTFTPLFSNHTRRSFTYAIGFGVDFDVPQNWRLGIGYRFSNLGRTKLGSGVIDTTPIPSSLSTSHLYTNDFVAQLSYVFK